MGKVYVRNTIYTIPPLLTLLHAGEKKADDKDEKEIKGMFQSYHEYRISQFVQHSTTVISRFSKHMFVHGVYVHLYFRPSCIL